GAGAGQGVRHPAGVTGSEPPRLRSNSLISGAGGLAWRAVSPVMPGSPPSVVEFGLQGGGPHGPGLVSSASLTASPRLELPSRKLMPATSPAWGPVYLSTYRPLRMSMA